MPKKPMPKKLMPKKLVIAKIKKSVNVHFATVASNQVLVKRFGLVREEAVTHQIGSFLENFPNIIQFGAWPLSLKLRMAIPYHTI